MKKIVTLAALLATFLAAFAQPPVITSFSPVSGPVGTTVTISGTNFSPVAADNIVYFGVVRAPVISASPAALTVTVPAGATYQPIAIAVNGLIAYSTKPFILTFQNSGAGFFANSFAQRITFSTSDYPLDIVTGDLDSDGKPDVAVTNLRSGTFSIFRNTSSVNIISFTRTDYATETYPGEIAIGDLNGDGKLDIVVTNGGSGTISAFTNTSTNGMIAFAARTDIPTGNSPSSIAIGDLDGDGKPDLAITSGPTTTNGIISVFRNVSSGGILSFAAAQDYPSGVSPYGIAIGDLNGDQRPDLAWVNINSNTASVLRNTSTTGTVAFAGKTDYATDTRPISLALGDIDGDGKPDVGVLSDHTTFNQLQLFRNTSTGSAIVFAPRKDFALEVSQPRNLTIGDLDGDGKPDVTFSNTTDYTVSVFRNLSTAGNIVFTTGIKYAAGDNFDIAIDDMDGDGRPDIVATNNYDNEFSVLRNEISCIPPTFLNNGQIVKDASCGGSDGSISIIPTSGSAPYRYSIDGGATYIVGGNQGYTLNNLPPGSYQVRMKDANGCESNIVERIIGIRYGLPTFLNNNQIVLDATCGASDGNITIVPMIGTAPFLYSIDGGATYITGPASGNTFMNLAPGTYQLRLKDAKGCESDVIQRTVRAVNCPATCTPPTFLNNTQIVRHASCNGNDGSISVIPTSGIAPFQYSLDGGKTYVAGPDTGLGFDNLAPGTYQLRLKDANGCESGVAEKTVVATNVLNMPILFTRSATCGSGGLIIIGNPAIPGYQYSIDGGNTYSSSSFFGVGPGAYYLKVKFGECESLTVPVTIGNIILHACVPFASNRQTPTAVIEHAAITGNESLQVYPNPTAGRFRLQLNGFASEKVLLQVLNSKGQVVEEKRMNVSESNAVAFDLSGKAKGFYLIKVTGEKGTQVTKVLLQ